MQNMDKRKTILIVDDSENDIFLMHRAFKKDEFDSPLREVYNGEQDIAFLAGEVIYSNRDDYPMPSMVLLDLNMPKKNGFDVLAWVRAQPQFKRLAVVVTT